jgi:hypothetical protein
LVALTKGIAFTHARAYVEETFSPSAWVEVLSRVPPEDREVLGSTVATGWYELGLYARLLRTIDAHLGQSNLELLTQIGRWAAEQDFTTIYRLFFRFADPIYAIEKLAEYWRRFHDSGTWTVERSGQGRATGTLREWGFVDRALCRETAAYMSRVLELVGATEVRLTHPRCRADGGGECFFTLTWRPRRPLHGPSSY